MKQLTIFNFMINWNYNQQFSDNQWERFFLKMFDAHCNMSSLFVYGFTKHNLKNEVYQTTFGWANFFIIKMWYTFLLYYNKYAILTSHIALMFCLICSITIIIYIFFKFVPIAGKVASQQMLFSEQLFKQILT